MKDFTAEQTQKNADARHGRDEGHLWRVALPGVPVVTLPAIDRESAIAKYNALCGITGTTLMYHVELIEERPLPPAAAEARNEAAG